MVILTKIFIDAGHGINTPGKRTPDNEREWTFNNIVAIAFENRMKEYEGVSLTRTDDRTGKSDIPLATRTNAANKANADIYISFHHNAFQSKWGTHTGVEIYYSKGSVKGLALAKAVQPALVKAYGLRDRGLKTNNFHITRETKMPAILIEGGFMDSSIDIKKLRDKKVLENAGILIADAVASHLKLKKKAVAKPSTPKPSVSAVNKNTFYRVVAGSYNDRKNADAQVAKLKKLGIDGVFIDVFEK